MSLLRRSFPADWAMLRGHDHSRENLHRDRSGPGTEPTPVIAIASVVASMALIAVGNGLMFAYIPVRLGAEGFDPTWAGLIITGLSAGGLAGCILTGPLVRRVGHARAFMVLSALIALSNAAVGAGPYPLLWIAARALYGFAICGLFIVAQSWLNDAVANAIRGRVMAFFYVAYVAGLGVGYATLALVDIRTADAPLIGIVFTALSILPVGMTRLAQPPAPQAASVALGRAWRISPVGVAGMLAVGGLSMAIAGFAPIHATAKGYSQAGRGAAAFGDAGRHADPADPARLDLRPHRPPLCADRRVRARCMVAGMLALGFDGGALTVLVVIYIVWDGASESIYSLASAHAARPRRQGRHGGAVELAAVCLVAVGLRRARHRDGAVGRLRHADLHLCGDRSSPPSSACSCFGAWSTTRPFRPRRPAVSRR